MKLIEKRIDGELQYKGIIVNVHLDRAELVNGAIVKREIVEHPGGVTILPVDEDGCSYLVRQYRYPIGKMMLEAPAGKLEYGEDPLECALRELKEETGFTADNIVYFGKCCTSPGISTEVLHIYLATGLHSGESHPDDNEFLNVEKYSLDELDDMICNNEIEDAKTQVAILRALRYLRNK